MTLKELESYFIRYEKQIAGPGHGRLMPDGNYQYGGFEIWVLIHTDSLSEAQGIKFLCPACFKNNNGSIGTHSITISFEHRNVPDEAGSRNDQGQPSRWSIIGGTGLDDLQLSPSIFIKNSPCQWHGFIGNSGILPGNAQ